MIGNEILLINPPSPGLRKGMPHSLLEEKLIKIQLEYQKEKLSSLGLKINDPPVYGYQIHRGLLCIASKLIEAGLKPKYLQIDYEKDRYPEKSLKDILESYSHNVDIVGITSYTQNFYEAVKIAKVLKSINPQIKVIFGGYHASALDVETLTIPYIDIVVRGEGENTFKNLCINLLEGRSIETIKGISYKSKDGKIIRNPPADFLEGKEIPIPAYSLVENIKDKTIVLETTRGCPMRCIFCAEGHFWKRKIRYREIKDVVKEIKLIKSMGYTGIHISDSYFPINKKYANNLLSELKNEKIGMYFNCNVRVDTLDNEILKKLSSANFYGFFVGLESCSDKVLGIMRKGITFDKYYNSLKKVREYIPIIDVSLIIGHPGEDKETIKETLKKTMRLLEEGLVDSVWPHIFVPYPGTEPFYHPHKYNMTILTKEWDRYNRRFPVCRLSELSELDIYKAYEEFLITLLKWWKAKR